MDNSSLNATETSSRMYCIKLGEPEELLVLIRGYELYRIGRQQPIANAVMSTDPSSKTWVSMSKD